MTSKHYQLDLKYHIVLVCKYRIKLLKYLGPEVINIIKLLSYYLDYKVLGINTDLNHIHILIKYNDNILTLIPKIKGITTYLIKQLLKLRNSKFILPKGKLWSSGAYVNSVGNNLNKVRNYIKLQGIK